VKYFTPELYLRFNSDNRTAASKAHDDWESAIEKYRRNLDRIRHRLSPSARRLSKSLCLHDALYLGLARPKIPRLPHSIAVLATRKNSTVFLLVYTLAKEPRVEDSRHRWPFSKRNVHWLYDEFDIEPNGDLSHAILLSDGRSIVIDFKDVQLIKDHRDASLDVA
jgi:hypothetical protein